MLKVSEKNTYLCISIHMVVLIHHELIKNKISISKIIYTYTWLIHLQSSIMLNLAICIAPDLQVTSVEEQNVRHLFDTCLAQHV